MAAAALGFALALVARAQNTQDGADIAARRGQPAPATEAVGTRPAAPDRVGSLASTTQALPTTPQETEAQRLPEVIVHGRQEDLIGVADTSNQGYVGAEDLARRPILRPAEIVEAVPGLVMTQHSGPGKANQYFLRGFQLDHGTDFAVTLAGVPQNLPSHAHGQGYLDLNYLIPELVSDIEYRKGPYFADVGDFSLAGSADIHYVDALPRGFAKMEAGSYGFARVLVADSIELGPGHLLYAMEAEYEDGPWDVPDRYKKLNAVLRYSGGDKDNGFRITGLGYHGEWTATNQVAQRAIDQGIIDPFGSLNSHDGGNSQRYTLVAEAHQKDAQSESHLLGWGAWYDLDLFNDFTYFLNDPVSGDQFEQQDRRFYGGLRASHTWFTELLKRPSDVTIGIQTRTDDINNGLYNTQDRQRLTTVEKADILQTSAGVYLENRTQWTSWFRTEAGLRGDFYSFHVRSSVAGNSGDKDAAILGPKLDLIFGPWFKTELYLSGGYGFHSNDARGVTTTVVPSTLLPAARVTPLVRGKGAEVGLRTSSVPHLQSTVSLWVLDNDSEQVFNGDSAETVPSGPSRRYGVELSNFYSPVDWMTLDADYSVSQARFTDNEPGGDYVPESIKDVLEAGITVHDIPGLRKFFGSVRVRYFGPRPLTQDDSVQSNSSTIVNAQVGYNLTPQLSATVDFLNLFNVKTDDIQYYYNSRLQGEPAGGVNDRHVHPAEPFEVRVGLTYRF